MRPRVFPAEDAASAHHISISYCCFNEAAGIPRGRRDGRRLEYVAIDGGLQ